MRVRWSMEYRGLDPINARRKVTHVLRVAAIDVRVASWIESRRYVEFSSELQAQSWEAAIAEVLDLAARFSSRRELSLQTDAIHGARRERKVECVEVLSFELRRDPVLGMPNT